MDGYTAAGVPDTVKPRGRSRGLWPRLNRAVFYGYTDWSAGYLIFNSNVAIGEKKKANETDNRIYTIDPGVRPELP